MKHHLVAQREIVIAVYSPSCIGSEGTLRTLSQVAA